MAQADGWWSALNTVTSISLEGHTLLFVKETYQVPTILLVIVVSSGFRTLMRLQALIITAAKQTAKTIFNFFILLVRGGL